LRFSKRLFPALVLTIFLLAALIPTVYATPSAAIVNGGFESGILTPWSLVQLAGNTNASVADSTNAFKAFYAAKFVSANGTNTFYLKQIIILTDVAITQYNFTAWFKGNNTNYQARIDVLEIDAGGGVLDINQGNPITISSSWQQAYVNVYTDELFRTKKLEIQLRFTGTDAANRAINWADDTTVIWYRTFEWSYPYLTIQWNNTQNSLYQWNFTGSHPKSWTQLHPVVVDASTAPFNFTTQWPYIGGPGNGTWRVLVTTNVTSYGKFETIRIKYDSYVGPVYSTAPLNATVDQYTVRITFHELGLKNHTLRIDQSFYPYSPRKIDLINCAQNGNFTNIEAYRVNASGVITDYPSTFEFPFRTLPFTARQDLIFTWAPSGFGANEAIVVGVGVASVIAAGIVYVNRRRRTRP